jgi:hypothetical protein
VFRELHAEVTAAARTKLARESRAIRGVFVFFGVLNLMDEIDYIMRVEEKSGQAFGLFFILYFR